MRKTSQDGGDSTSITSGIENEIKKPGAIIKTKRNSIKRKVQNFSHESDDAVVEPLLQKEKEKKDKEKTDISNQSAKYNLMSKTKTDFTSERGGDKDKLLKDDKLQTSALCNTSDDTDSALSTYNMKENSMPKFTSVTGPTHNHMNTNVFSSHDALKGFVAPKSQILVEIDGSKQVGYSPSPLIFTTAKIHTDGKTKHMEPLQVTPVPILSTIEVSVLNIGKNKGETSGLVNSSISTMYTNIPKNNIKTIEKEQKPPLKTVNNTQTASNKVVDTKIETLTDKTTVSIFMPATNLTKDTKMSYPKVYSDSIKDNVDKYDNKRITMDSKKDQAGNETKMHTSPQPTVFSTSGKTKAVSPNETVKIEHITPTTTNTTSIKKYTKDSGAVNQEVAISKDKTDSHKYPEMKNNLDINVKSENLDSQLSKASDNVSLQSNVMYTSDQTSKDKPVTNSTSFNGRQLQRQSIVTDKDDHITKIKTEIGSYSSIDDSKNLSKVAELSNSSVIERNSEKTKIPKPNAGSVPVTCNSAMSILNSVAVSKTSASITTDAAAAKMSASIITTASVNKTSTSITTAAPLNKMSAPITTTAIVNKSAPITTAAATNKTSIPKTTISSINKSSAPIITSGAINKKSASITTAASVGKTSIPIITTTIINKASASITTAAVNITCAPISTSAAINTTSPITTTVSVNKSSVPISSGTATNKSSIPITNIASVNKLPATVITAAATYKISTPVITTAAASKTSAPVNTTSAVNKTVVSISTSAAANKSSFSSITPSSLNTLPTSLHTPIPKQAIATTLSTSEPLSTEKYSVGKATISGNTVLSKTASSNSTTKSQVKGTVNPKPSNSTTPTNLTKASTVVTPITTSQPSVIIKPSTVTAAKSETTELSNVEIQGKSTENTTKSSTSNVEPFTAKSNSTVKSSPISVSHEISNVTSAATTSSNSVSSNKQSKSKSNELSNGNKSFKA